MTATTAMVPSTPVTSTIGWHALRDKDGLRLLSAACQAWLHRVGNCTACRDACPVDALLFEPSGLALLEDCLGCGRCVPACPMGALNLPDLVHGTPSDHAPVRVDCRRVPAPLRTEVSVPCLGALDAAALLEMTSAGRGVEVLDRGWCAECPVGGGDPVSGFPALQAIHQATKLLTDGGWPADLHPRRVLEPLPGDVALPVRAGAPMSRRAFFGRLAKPVRDVAATPVIPLTPPPRQPAASPSHPSLARARWVAAVQALPRRGTSTETVGTLGSPPPHVALQAGSRCCNHQGCIRLCPTGALRPYQAGTDGATVSGVEFDARLCIDCGLCIRHCPEQALTRRVQDESVLDWDSPVPLTRHASRRCEDCDTPYSVPDGQAYPGCCDPCHKSRQLARDMFYPLFATRP